MICELQRTNYKVQSNFHVRFSSINFCRFLIRTSYIVFCTFFLTSCKNSFEDVKLITSRANVKIEKGEDVEINYSDNGVVRIQASGPVVTRYNSEKPYLEFSNGIQILFYNETHAVDSKLTAKYATAIENSKSMTARDSVVVINNKGEILNTDELIWDEDKKIIYSNSFVKITTADEIIYGNGMTANENFTDYVIKHITGTIKVKTSELE
ncbi:MAG: LPS export ABC transporter periplasmic protein LptC [Bacteroidota bacterium]